MRDRWSCGILPGLVLAGLWKAATLVSVGATGEEPVNLREALFLSGELPLAIAWVLWYYARPPSRRLRASPWWRQLGAFVLWLAIMYGPVYGLLYGGNGPFVMLAASCLAAGVLASSLWIAFGSIRAGWVALGAFLLAVGAVELLWQTSWGAAVLKAICTFVSWDTGLLYFGMALVVLDWFVRMAFCISLSVWVYRAAADSAGPRAGAALIRPAFLRIPAQLLVTTWVLYPL